MPYIVNHKAKKGVTGPSEYIDRNELHMRKKDNYVRRSMARGAGARHYKGMPTEGANAYAIAKKSAKGHYKLEFTEILEKMTDKDISLREVYGRELVANHVGVPADMLHLHLRSSEQTLTTLNEVYYVKRGKEVYGKLSIRTQRAWKHNSLTFVFQTKGRNVKPPKSFSRRHSFKPRTKSMEAETKRQSYRNRREGRY